MGKNSEQLFPQLSLSDLSPNIIYQDGELTNPSYEEVALFLEEIKNSSVPKENANFKHFFLTQFLLDSNEETHHAERENFRDWIFKSIFFDDEIKGAYFRLLETEKRMLQDEGYKRVILEYIDLLETRIFAGITSEEQHLIRVQTPERTKKLKEAWNCIASGFDMLQLPLIHPIQYENKQRVFLYFLLCNVSNNYGASPEQRVENIFINTLLWIIPPTQSANEHAYSKVNEDQDLFELMNCVRSLTGKRPYSDIEDQIEHEANNNSFYEEEIAIILDNLRTHQQTIKYTANEYRKTLQGKNNNKARDIFNTFKSLISSWSSKRK